MVSRSWRSHTQRTPAGDPALPELVGNADLAESRLLDRQRYDSILDLLRHAVLQHRLLATDFLQGQFAALVVELLEPVEAVAAVAHHRKRAAALRPADQIRSVWCRTHCPPPRVPFRAPRRAHARRGQ